MSISKTQSPSYVSNKAGLSVYNGTEPVEVSVGSDGQILSAQSSASSGVSWISTSLGTARYSPIASGTLTAVGTSEITISSITGGYKNLFVEIEGSAVSVSNTSNLEIYVNSDSTTSYFTVQMTVRTSALFADYSDKDTAFKVYGAVQGTASYTSGSLGVLQMLFSNYSDTSKYKTLYVRRTHSSAWTGLTANRTAFSSGIYQSTSAITSVKMVLVSGSFRDGTNYKVYVY